MSFSKGVPLPLVPGIKHPNCAGCGPSVLGFVATPAPAFPPQLIGFQQPVAFEPPTNDPVYEALSQRLEHARELAQAGDLFGAECLLRGGLKRATIQRKLGNPRAPEIVAGYLRLLATFPNCLF